MADPNLRVRISADLADIRQGIGLLRGELAKVKSDAAKTAPSTSSWSASLKGIRSQLAGILSVYAALRAVKTYAELSDQASKLNGQLKLATKTQEEFAKAYEKTYQLAQDSQSDWQSIVGLFSQLTQTTGQSQDRILNLTKIISQAFRVSSASVQDTSNGIRQLQQAMAGGTLRAEEFNTIIDTAPRIVQALADHFGIAFGQVRKYVNNGKVSTQAFMAALEESAGSIETDFNKLPKTVGGAVQEVRNALVKMVGDTNTATGASSELSGAISGLARTLESPGIKQGFVSFISLLVKGAEKAAILTAKIGNLASAVREYFGELEKKSDVALRNQRDELETSLFKAQRRSGQGLADANDPIAKIFGLPADRDAQIAELKKQIGEIDKIIDQRRKNRAAEDDGSKGTIVDPVFPTTTTPGKQVAASNALMRDSVDRAIAELERLYKAGEIGIQEYFATRTQLQQQSIDLDIQQARNELAVTKDKGQRIKIEEQIAILQRDRAEVATAAAQEEKLASADMIDKLGEVQAKLAELDGNTAKAARIRIYAEFHELFKLLEVNSDATGKKMVQNLVDRLINKAQADQIASKVSEATGLLSSKEQSISAQVGAGTLGYLEGERRLLEVRRGTLEQLRTLRQAQADYLKSLSPNSPDYAAALQGLYGIETGIANIQASMDTFGQGVADAGVSSLNALFTSIRENGTLTLNSLREGVAQFAASVYDIIAQDFSKSIVSSVRGFLGGGADAATETTSATAAATIKTTAATTAASIDAAASATSAATMTAGAATAGGTLIAAGASLAATLVAAAIQAAAILQAQATASAVTSSIGSVAASAKGNVFGNGGLLAFAKGAAFALPGLTAFANGGAFTNSIFASPQLFKFGAGGEFGVMGEAGPEAVMPLTRGPGGRLGVDANGGGGGKRMRVIVVDDRRQAQDYMTPGFEDAQLVFLDRNAGKVKEILGG